MLPPLIQMPKFYSIKIHPQISKIFPPFTQITPKLFKFHPLIRISLPAVLTYSQAIENLPLHIKSKIKHIKAPSQVTKLQCQITRQIPTLEPKLLAQILAIINRSLALSKAGMILLIPGLRKGLRGTLPR